MMPNSQHCGITYTTLLKDFPGGPVTKTVLPMQGTWVQALVRELEPTCLN